GIRELPRSRSIDRSEHIPFSSGSLPGPEDPLVVIHHQDILQRTCFSHRRRGPNVSARHRRERKTSTPQNAARHPVESTGKESAVRALSGARPDDRSTGDYYARTVRPGVPRPQATRAQVRWMATAGAEAKR